MIFLQHSSNFVGLPKMCINGISPDFSFGSLWIFGLKCPMRITSSLSLWPKKKYDFLWREMGSGFLCSGNGGKIRDLFSGIQNIFAIHQFLYYKNNSRGYGIHSLFKNKNWWIADISSNSSIHQFFYSYIFMVTFVREQCSF